MDYNFSFRSGQLFLATTGIDSCEVVSIITGNNTPPASRQISAPRGVTRFWGDEK